MSRLIVALSLALLAAACSSSRNRATRAGYDAWRGGELIQRALPEVDFKDRERLISGMCDPCWQKLWAPEEER